MFGVVSLLLLCSIHSYTIQYTYYANFYPTVGRRIHALQEVICMAPFNTKWECPSFPIFWWPARKSSLELLLFRISQIFPQNMSFWPLKGNCAAAGSIMQRCAIAGKEIVVSRGTASKGIAILRPSHVLPYYRRSLHITYRCAADVDVYRLCKRCALEYNHAK